MVSNLSHQKMKAIATLLAFSLLVTACLNKNGNNKEGALKSQTSGIKEAENGTDTTTISIVFPSIPERAISVGGAAADIKGFSSEAIQTAVNALHNEGGGKIILLPGTFDIIAPVKLYSNISLSGAGLKSVLKKCKGFRSAFALDADYGELQVTVTDASGFRQGMGVAVYDDDKRSGWDLTTARIAFIKGNVLHLDDYLLRDYRSDKHGMISNACSVIEAVEAENIRISDLVVDGNGKSNDMVDGCRAGGIYLHKVRNAVVENITVKNFNCDGISWQITEHVTVSNCEVYDCSNSGLHPGTGSPYTLVEGNKCHDNGGYGLFVCWRVRNGAVRNNIFSNNGKNGISTGHKDTDMLFEGNHIFENGSDGIYLRGESDLNAPHRTIFKNNTIENNGTKEEGAGITINCRAEGVTLENNIIRNTGTGKQLAAVRLLSGSLPVIMKDNIISGHPKGELIKE